MKMKISLYWKIILAFVLVAFTASGLVALIIRASSPDRLSRLIIDQQRNTLTQALASYYRENHSWDQVPQVWGRYQWLTSPTPSANGGIPEPEGRPGFERERRGLFGLADQNGVVVVSVEPGFPPGTKLPDDVLKNSEPILIDGSTVGYVFLAGRIFNFNPAETLFLRRTYQAILLAMFGGLLVAIIIGLWLGRRLVQPINALMEAAQRIAGGALEQEVRVNSNDEIGQLAEAFNHMSRAVALANQSRRQMTADIAHDLRTPLTVIGGYIESMRDGVLSPSPERFALIYSEIERLQKMVEDLRTLSQADAGELALQFQAFPARHLLERTAVLFEHHARQQGITLKVELAPSLPPVKMDEGRLMQVMDNLLSNALRYTPEGGTITLSARPIPEGVEYAVADTGEGIPAEELPRIFERFYRADPSRHTEAGESGLGLAIVRAIIEAHGGRVWAESQEGQGTVIRFILPAQLKEAK